MEASMHKSAVRKWGRLVRDCFSVWKGNHQPFFFVLFSISFFPLVPSCLLEAGTGAWRPVTLLPEKGRVRYLSIACQLCADMELLDLLVSLRDVWASHL